MLVPMSFQDLKQFLFVARKEKTKIMNFEKY